MASLAGTNLVGKEYPVAVMLYHMLKESDFKLSKEGWENVAAACNISNGHAARMRYSRFRDQVEEGTEPTKRGRPAGTGNKPTGIKKNKAATKPTEDEVAKYETFIKNEFTNRTERNDGPERGHQHIRAYTMKDFSAMNHYGRATTSATAGINSEDGNWDTLGMDVEGDSRMGMEPAFEYGMWPIRALERDATTHQYWEA